MVSCLVLGWAGGQQPEGLPLFLGRLAGAYYFLYFLLVLPLLPRFEKTKPLPDSISASLTKALVIITLAVGSLMPMGGAMADSQAEVKIPKEAWSFLGLFGVRVKSKTPE